MSEKAKINFLSPVAASPRWRRRRIARALLVTAVLSTAVLFIADAAAPGESFAPLIEQLPGRTFFAGVGRLFLSNDRLLKGESADRINVLLLGIGGEGHDGPELTDTIIIFSYRPSTRQAAMISIPRDLLVNIPGYGWRRVNTVNAYAEANRPGSGGRQTAALLADLLGLDIPYYVRVDFTGFRRLIDQLGGVLVYIERPFVDLSYPAPHDLIQAISFAAGWQRLDGERALIYARSRHGSNGEGSDFARSRRQQKILTAVKEELLTAGVLTNPSTLSSIWEIIQDHLQTNVEPWELLKFAALAREQNPDGIIHRTLDPESGGPLVAANVGGAYVLLPSNGNYSELREIVANVFAEKPEQESGAPRGVTRSVRLEIQNGTVLSGFAARAAESLKSRGFAVSYVGNARSKNYDRSVIYDLSSGRYPEELARLRTLLDADVSVTIPEWFSPSPLPPAITPSLPTPQGGRSSADFLVILGQSSASLLTSS